MANVAVTSSAWTEISITSGTVQNISATADIELSAEQVNNSGVVLKPAEIYQWDNETIYARAVTEATGALRVVNFKKAAGGGGGYVLPVASPSTLGGVKVGNNLSIDASGVLSATGGGSSDYDPVGRVVYDVILRDGYIKANGATVADASTAVPNLLQFVQDNSATLLAADAAAYEANVGLYLYDSDTDELTLPNYIGRTMQGENSVEAKAAGLPNITGYFWGDLATYGTKTNLVNAGGTVDESTKTASLWNGACRVHTSNYEANWNKAINSSSETGSVALWASFDASHANAIYSNSQTVQPPAITLIPQIKY